MLRNLSTPGNVLFALPVGFAVGDTSYSPCAADFDGDGKPDLAVVSNYDNTVILLRNNSVAPGIISFEPKIAYNTGTRPADAQAADIDGDGKLDIVISNIFSNSISVLRNNASAGVAFVAGSFNAHVDFLTNNSPAGIALGDMNGDGKIDIVVANAARSNVSIFRNTSSPGIINASSLSTSDSITTGFNPFSATIGDLDGDGYPDIIATDNSFGKVSLLRNYPLPPVDTISGIRTLCFSASPVTFIDTTTGGFWSITNTALATINSFGTLTPIAPGIDTIFYSKVAGGDTNRAMFIVTIDSTPIVYPIGGPSSVCAGVGSITETNGTPAGTWSIGNPLIATVNSGGIANGIAIGNTFITYSFSNTCGTASTTKAIAVTGVPVIGAITGNHDVCGATSTTLSDTTSGGTWGSSPPTTATINSSGVVTGINPGPVTISYSKSNTCGTGIATISFTVNTSVSAGVITPTPSSTLCEGTTISLSSSAPGGSWMSLNNSIATVTNSGVVYGVLSDTVTIKYIVTNSCGSSSNSIRLTVNPQANPGNIIGPSGLCIGSTVTLNSTVAGGSWTASNGAATVTPISFGATINGNAAGIDTINYSVSNSCGTHTVKHVVSVAPAPDAGTISGLSSVCVGVTMTLTDAAAGGTWGASNGAATVSGGVVAGVTPGGDTITYVVTNACNTATAQRVITINPQPAVGAINGISAVCESAIITLTDTSSTGLWGASNTHASVSGGVVTGTTAGVDTISYTVANGCGSVAATKVVTINPAPNAGSISGTSIVCVGVTTTLTVTSTGGNWSATNGKATVTGGGVMGINTGIDTIRYSVSNSCGLSVATRIVTVDPQPIAAPIIGLSVVCPGQSITLSDTSSGGTWNATNTHASVAGGVVNGVTAGVDTIIYTVANACGTITATRTITINPAPNSGIISGTAPVCVGSTTTLTDTASGGTWSTSNGTANNIGGSITGVSPGTDTIKYTVTNSCGTSVAIKIVTVNAQPFAGAISGLSDVCQGAAITLSDTASGGVWSAANTHASVTGGVVSGNSAGTDTIFYRVSNICGIVTASKIITVYPAPDAGNITGPAIVCTGTIIILADTSSAGVWNTSNGFATVSGDTVTGMHPGTDTITYSVTNSCGTAHALKIITIITQPHAGAITGLAIVCEGALVTLTDTSSGGTWAASNGHASVSSGIVSGISQGIDTISYTISNICGSAATTLAVTVNPAPNAGVITGISSLCIGQTVTLTDLVSGGSWNASNSSAVIFGGLTTGSYAGADTITYSITNSCGTAVSNKVVTVAPPLYVGPINGSSTVCVGAILTLTDTTLTGSWGATNGNATVISGLVSGLHAGIDTIRYTISNACSTAVATKVITIPPVPLAGTISGPSFVCIGSPITLSDTISGGTWTVSNSHAMAADSVITGQTAGIDTISYTITNACGIDVAKKIIAVIPLPDPGTITGGTSTCVGSTVTLSDTASGGSWSSSNALASVSVGIVHALASGTDTIRYNVTNSCGTASAAHVISITSLPDAGIISGGSSACTGAVITLSSTVAGGAWSSQNPFIATISSNTGMLTGLSNGTTTISYVVNNGCGNDTAFATFTVNPLPDPGIISGPSSVCAGSTISLTDTVTGGVWSVNNANAAVSSGLITGVSAGTDTVYFTVSNGCATLSASKIIVVELIPDTGTISGVTNLCTGLTTQLSETATGGIWSSVSASIATVTATGLVTALASGTGIIRYGFTNSCGTFYARDTININPTPVLTSGLTPPSICDSTLFNYIPQSSFAPTAIFNWTRPAIAGISNVPSAGTGNPGEALYDTTSLPLTVVYTYIGNTGQCADTQNVSVIVNPVPVLAGKLLDSVCSRELFSYVPSSNTPGTSFTWSRPGIPGIAQPAVFNVVGGINESLVNTTSSRIDVVYSFTLTANGCSRQENVTLHVDPSPSGPMITTMSPPWLCSHTMFQNFGTHDTTGGVEYNWSTTGGATIWATGSTRQYCLVNFLQPGICWVNLSTTIPGYNCPAFTAYEVVVGNNISESPEVVYFNRDFICLQNNEDTYQWGFDDAQTLDSSLVLGATNQNYHNEVPDLLNKYYWVITTHDGCVQKTYYNTPVAISAVKPLESLSARISPNPNAGYFSLYVSSEVTGEAHITITNIWGQVIDKENVPVNRENQLKLNAPAGIYFLNARVKDETITVKLIIAQ